MESLEIDLKTNPMRGPWRGGLKLGAASTLALGMLCVGGIAYDFLHFGADAGTWFIVSIVGFFGAFNFGLAALAIYALYYRPLTDSVHVGADGVVLRCADGSMLSLPWSSSATRIQVTELQAPDTETRRKGLLRVPHRTWINLTQDQLQATRGWVQLMGVRFSVKKEWIKYRGPATTWDVRGGAA
jgi:hypothetical protein